VVHRCAEYEVGSGGRGSGGKFDSYLAHGDDEFGAGSVDWGLPDFVGGVSGDVAIDVDDRGRTGGGESALEFSFFLSMPTMAVATLYTLYKSIHGTKTENPIGVSSIDAHGWIVLAIGFVVSFIVAYGSVAWFMAWVRRRGFGPFAVYRIIVGILVLFFAAKLVG
jgi:hypothetical protein